MIMSSELGPDSAMMTENEFVNATVLVVDDEANIVTLLQTWLETIGCRVESANDGESGVCKALELSPDLILMDGMMPRMSGFDACKKLKEEPATRDIPVIFLTVQGEVRDVVKGLELGAHGYMTKPFKPQELLARVRSTLKIKQIQDRLKVHTQKLRQQWNWMHGVIESLPLGLLVFDPETDAVVYINDQLTEILGLTDWSERSSELSKELSFSKAGERAVSVWDPAHDLDEILTITLSGTEKCERRVRARTFEKNGRVGRQILVDLVNP
jgi:DNA-binding response OmpR family regulator